PNLDPQPSELNDVVRTDLWTTADIHMQGNHHRRVCQLVKLAVTTLEKEPRCADRHSEASHSHPYAIELPTQDLEAPSDTHERRLDCGTPRPEISVSIQ